MEITRWPQTSQSSFDRYKNATTSPAATNISIVNTLRDCVIKNKVMSKEKYATFRPKADSAEMEIPAFNVNPWVSYKWVLTEPFANSQDEADSKQRAEDEVTAELAKATQDFIIEEFKWTVTGQLTYRLRVKLQRAPVPSTGVKTPQPPPPPPTFP